MRFGGSARSRQSRRRFLEGLIGAAAVPSAIHAAGGSRGADRAKAARRSVRSRVVLVRNARVLDGRNRADRSVLRAMVERGVRLLTGLDETAQVWRSFFSPEDVIGLKVNCLGGPTLCTHPALAEAVAESLVAADIPEKNIIIWDRTDGELSRCGYRLNKSGRGRRCFGTQAYEDEVIKVGGVRTRLSTLATRTLTAMINLPVLKSHTLAGLSGALKNELGCVANPRDFHPADCRAAADVCALEVIARKRRLVICDALRPLYDRGPTDMPRFRWVYGGLLFATDAVAADLVGRKILEDRRRFVAGGKVWPLSPPPAHLDRAIALGLGAASLDGVELIEA